MYDDVDCSSFFFFFFFSLRLYCRCTFIDNLFRLEHEQTVSDIQTINDQIKQEMEEAHEERISCTVGGGSFITLNFDPIFAYFH